MSSYRKIATFIATAVTLMAFSACGALNTFGEPAPAATPAAPAAVAPTESVFDSQFTDDGTYQSHIDLNGVDFVLTIWPTKSTPRTHEWYPLGNKFFSFTLTAYDLDRGLRDKFATKRKVYLSRIRVSAKTVTQSGTVETPYLLSSPAARITLDPEPVTSKYGMLITSPKGAFELRNQKIGDLAPDTHGLTLSFEATVSIQQAAKSKSFDTQTIHEDVPITIFKSRKPTKVTPIPIDAN